VFLADSQLPSLKKLKKTQAGVGTANTDLDKSEFPLTVL